MTLGDFVRVTRTFIEGFKPSEAKGEQSEQHEQEDDAINVLRDDLKGYQELVHLGIKDDRIRRPLPRRTIVLRMFIRLGWPICLMSISFPGLILWAPVFVVTFYAVHNFKKSGPMWDTWDEVAQYKLVYSASVWILAVLLTLPFATITVILVHALMWMTLRWLEDAISAFRAFTTLLRLLWVGSTSYTVRGIICIHAS